MDSQEPNTTEKVKRGYRACLHCRSRKARCDLGDIDAPSSPPCSRCKRESRECVFAPSRRGGNNRKRLRITSEDQSESDVKPAGLSRGAGEATSSEDNHHPQTFPYPHPPRGPHSSSVHSLLGQSPPSGPYYHHLSAGGSSSSHFSPGTVGSTHTTPQGGRPSTSSAPAHHPQSGGHSHPPPSSPPSPKHRRLGMNPPLHATDPSSIVVADMRNESDALQILALASGQAASQDAENDNEGKRGQQSGQGGGAMGLTGILHPQNEDVMDPRRKEASMAQLGQFPLIRLGIVTEDQTMMLADAFFRCHHHFFPIIPSSHIPRTVEQLAVFAENEKYLLASFIIIASRPDNSPEMRDIHDRSWSVMRKWISDVQCLGEPPTVGLVEALLMLAENLPRIPRDRKTQSPDSDASSSSIEEPHGAENRQAWQMIGLAVRSAYEMGLDKLGLQLISDGDRNPEVERATLAWVYCYLFDRHISIRLGKGFWTRGGAVCFQGYSSSAQTGPAAALANFPFLRELKAGDPGVEHPQDDLGSLVQAYLELTMMMSNAHDVLYPNAARTRSLVVHGEYFKYIDEMARSLDGFKILWKGKKWTLFPLTDAVWVMFYYIQLFICAFSFQAHVERATIRGEEEYKLLVQKHKAKGGTSVLPRPSLSLFPRGAAQSPDARYIFQMCDAARELIHICVDNLYPGGALPYLPSRFLLWFTYGAIVLLKALYSGAMLRADHKRTLELIDRLCLCFAQCSTDEEYPAVRYGKQLEALRKKLAGLSDKAPAPSPAGNRAAPRPPQRARGQETRPTSSGSVSPPPPVQQDHQPADQETAWYPPSGPPSNGPHVDPGSWQPPFTNQYAQPVVFPYPTTPGPIGGHPAQGHQGPPGMMQSAFVPPPHQQPFMEFGNSIMMDGGINGMTGLNGDHNGAQAQGASNLGFTTLEDWFGFGGVGGVNGAGGVQDDGLGMPGAGLDLQDFWMNVGPGEAQGGFPFR
ncbi:hypothetical protein IAT38_006701 [Cryptococcus sp. DSM 104549]